MLEIKQLLAGRDFAIVNPAAGQMANFVYLVLDREAGKGALVDPAWDVRGLLHICEEEKVELAGAVATHAHPDHVGGRIFGFGIEGVARLVELAGVKVWVHEHDADQLRAETGLKDDDLTRVRGGDKLAVGGGELEVLHTPGHSPGGICLLAPAAAITGDTLFVGGCGRIDLPGSDPRKMWESLKKLAALPDDTVVYPGHHYGPARSSTIGEEKRTNPYLAASTLAEWHALMGG